MTTIYIISGTSCVLPPDWRAKRRGKLSPIASLRGAKLKIERANHHVKDVAKLLVDFQDSNVLALEKEPDGIHETLKLRIGDISDDLPIIIGETLFQLRSALDLLAEALPKASGPKKGTISFPICSKKNKAREFKRKIEKFSPAVQKFIRRLKPYEGGNRLLWALHRLRNNDAHIRLSVLALGGVSWKGTLDINIPWQQQAKPAMVILEYPTNFEKEIVLARGRFGATAYANTKPEITIAFNDIKGIKREPVINVLQQFVDLVQHIVDLADRLFFPHASRGRRP